MFCCEGVNLCQTFFGASVAEVVGFIEKSIPSLRVNVVNVCVRISLLCDGDAPACFELCCCVGAATCFDVSCTACVALFEHFSGENSLWTSQSIFVRVVVRRCRVTPIACDGCTMCFSCSSVGACLWHTSVIVCGERPWNQLVCLKDKHRHPTYGPSIVSAWCVVVVLIASLLVFRMSFRAHAPTDFFPSVASRFAALRRDIPVPEVAAELDDRPRLRCSHRC